MIIREKLHIIKRLETLLKALYKCDIIIIVIFIIRSQFLLILFPDDHSRVHLEPREGDPHSDYINASFIHVFLFSLSLIMIITFANI